MTRMTKIALGTKPFYYSSQLTNPFGGRYSLIYYVIYCLVVLLIVGAILILVRDAFPLSTDGLGL